MSVCYDCQRSTSGRCAQHPSFAVVGQLRAHVDSIQQAMPLVTPCRTDCPFCNSKDGTPPTVRRAVEWLRAVASSIERRDGHVHALAAAPARVFSKLGRAERIRMRIDEIVAGGVEGQEYSSAERLAQLLALLCAARGEDEETAG